MMAYWFMNTVDLVGQVQLSNLWVLGHIPQLGGYGIRTELASVLV